MFLWKSMTDYLFRSTLKSRSSWSSFWPSFFFIFFLKWVESHSVDLKIFRYYSLFYTSSFWFPEVHPLALWEVAPSFFFFSCWVIWYLRKTCPSSVSCVSFWLFLLSYLNPFLTVLHASGISSLLAISEDPSSAFFFNLLIWASFLFSFFFSHKLPGLPFFLLYVFGLQAFWAYHFFSFLQAPCAYFFGLGCCDFLDLNTFFFFFWETIDKFSCD